MVRLVENAKRNIQHLFDVYAKLDGPFQSMCNATEITGRILTIFFWHSPIWQKLRWRCQIVKIDIGRKMWIWNGGKSAETYWMDLFFELYCLDIFWCMCHSNVWHRYKIRRNANNTGCAERIFLILISLSCHFSLSVKHVSLFHRICNVLHPLNAMNWEWIRLEKVFSSSTLVANTFGQNQT